MKLTKKDIQYIMNEAKNIVAEKKGAGAVKNAKGKVTNAVNNAKNKIAGSASKAKPGNVQASVKAVKNGVSTEKK